MFKVFLDKKYWTLILGGSSGLGLATAKKLALHGMNICVVHRNSRAELSSISKSFEEIKKMNVGFIAFNINACDTVKRLDVIKTLKEELGPDNHIKCLVHSIAKGNLKAMATPGEPELEHDDFSLTIDSMAISLYDWVKGIFKAQLMAPDCRIVSFTSEGNSKAIKHYAAVSAAKVALEAITRSIALEFSLFGVRANCIQAGVTDTTSLRLIPGSSAMIENSIQNNPFHRITTPEDIANVVYLLCLDEAAWINGSIIKVDGGEHIV